MKEKLFMVIIFINVPSVKRGNSYFSYTYNFDAAIRLSQFKLQIAYVRIPVVFLEQLLGGDGHVRLLRHLGLFVLPLFPLAEDHQHYQGRRHYRSRCDSEQYQ